MNRRNFLQGALALVATPVKLLPVAPITPVFEKTVLKEFVIRYSQLDSRANLYSFKRTVESMFRLTDEEILIARNLSVREVYIRFSIGWYRSIVDYSHIVYLDGNKYKEVKFKDLPKHVEDYNWHLMDRYSC